MDKVVTVNETGEPFSFCSCSSASDSPEKGLGRCSAIASSNDWGVARSYMRTYVTCSVRDSVSLRKEISSRIIMRKADVIDGAAFLDVRSDPQERQ